MVCVHLFIVPAGVRNHDCRDTLDDRVIVCRHVNAKQAMHVSQCVVFVDAPCRPTVANKVFCTSCYLFPEVKEVAISI